MFPACCDICTHVPFLVLLKLLHLLLALVRQQTAPLDHFPVSPQLLRGRGEFLPWKTHVESPRYRAESESARSQTCWQQLVHNAHSNQCVCLSIYLNFAEDQTNAEHVGGDFCREDVKSFEVMPTIAVWLQERWRVCVLTMPRTTKSVCVLTMRILLPLPPVWLV